MHRDLKLENIVLSRKEDLNITNYEIKILDWGCSTIYNSN